MAPNLVERKQYYFHLYQEVVDSLGRDLPFRITMKLFTSQITWRVADEPLYLPHTVSHERTNGWFSCSTTWVG
jgi:hypothetical protein